MRRRALARRKQRPKTTRKSISPSTAACNAATANLQEIIVKAIVIGSGTIGSAVKKALEENGHKVVSIGRKSGDFQADISNPESLKALFTSIGPFDAVANAAGDVFPGPFEQTTDEQWANSIKSKGMGQINLVHSPATGIQNPLPPRGPRISLHRAEVLADCHDPWLSYRRNRAIGPKIENWSRQSASLRLAFRTKFQKLLQVDSRSEETSEALSNAKYRYLPARSEV
jgi:hypothetical protein